MRQLKWLSLLGLLLLGPSTYAQSVRFQSQAISTRGAGIANATVAVCTQPANTNTQPCSPLATLATSTSTTSGGANPLTADSFGNFFFYAAPGRYTVQIYGPAVSGQFVTPDVEIASTAGGSPLNGECAVTSTASLSAANLLCATSSTKIHIWPNVGIVSGAGLTIAAQLQVDAGSQISGSPTINGPIVAGPYQIFTGTPTLGNVTNFIRAVWFPGTDIVAQIGNGYAASPAAPSSTTILVDPPSAGGCWTATSTALFSTLNKSIVLQGTSGAGTTGSIPIGTCINYTPTTATSLFTIDWQPSTGNSYAAGSGIRDLALINNNCVTNGGCGSSAIAVNVGPVNQGARRAMFMNLSIDGFGTGIQYNDTLGLSWGVHHLNASFSHNTIGVSYTQSAGHENDAFTNCVFVSNGTGISIAGGDPSMFGGSMDSNTTVGVALTNNALVRTSGMHWENFSSTNLVYMTGTASTKWLSTNDLINDDTSGGSSASNWFSTGAVMIRGTNIFGGVGGRTYSGTVFNFSQRGSVDIFTASAAAFPDVTLCNPQICLLMVTDTSHLAGHINTTWWQVQETTAPTAVNSTETCYGDSTAHALKCSYNAGTFFQIPQVITTTSAAFATATTAGTCVQNTTAVAGATTSMVVNISPVTTPGVGAVWSAFVSSTGNVTINECAVATSAGGTIAFNIRVTP